MPKGTVDLPVLPMLAVTPEDGFAVSGKPEVTPPRVQLTGPKSVIKNLKSISTYSRELSGLRSSIAVTIPVVPPSGFDMQVQPESVTVRVQIVPVKTRVYENLAIVVYNVPPGVRVATSPARTRVEITGPPDEIDLLNKNSLTASVDFRTRERHWVCPAEVRLSFGFPYQARRRRLRADPEFRQC